MMLKSLIKQPKFWISFIFIAGCFTASLIYYFVADDHIPTVELKFDDNGYPIGKLPFTPADHPPLGTDNFNRDIFYVLLVGAKYTFGLALLIALLRVCFGFIFGVALRLYLPKLGKFLLKPFESFSVFPMTLLAFFILHWVIVEDRKHLQAPIGSMAEPPPAFNHSTLFRVVAYSLVLIVIALPLITATFYKLTDDIYQREFFETTRVLGGSRWHMLTKHFPPYLMPQFLIVFMREVIQVLILMTHLGVLNLFIGGSFLRKPSVAGSGFTYGGFINDWSALVGQYWDFIFTSYPYFALIPIAALTLATLSAKGILSSVERALNEKHDSLNDEKKAA